MTLIIESLQFDPYDTQVNLRAMMASVSTQHKGLNDAANIDRDVDDDDNDEVDENDDVADDDDDDDVDDDDDDAVDDDDQMRPDVQLL